MEEKMLKKTIYKIAKNYESLEASLVNQLSLETPNHQYTTGSYRENVWMSLFERMIPKKYCIEQGVFIIDSFGNISNEVDLGVYDETYTPYIFNYGKIKFIPIEAVSVVIQCKSKVSGKEMQTNLNEWVGSIDQLKTSLDSVSRIFNDLVDNYDKTLVNDKKSKNMTQTSTRPVKILCATGITGPMKTELKEKFDILLYIKKDHLVKEISKETNNFLEWNDSLNHYNYDRYSPEERKYRENCKNDGDCMKSKKSIGERKLSDLSVKDSTGQENIIMSLTFQLNQLLMLINNPMLFPHHAYANCFTGILGGQIKKETYILAQYDISGIQNYIFATNRLRENVGASFNVSRILKQFLPEAIKTVAGDSAITDWEADENGAFLSESNPDILAEVLYIGGGNAVVVYRNRQIYDDVSRNFAIRIAENCHGITVLSAFVETGWEEYSEKIMELEAELAELKHRTAREVPMSPWPIVEQDPVYGLPVTRIYDKEGVAEGISEIQYEKYMASHLEDVNGNTSWRFALQMDELIDKRGEDSYVAVIHIDGNGMGEMVRRIRNQHKDFKDAVPAMRKMSAAISRIYNASFERVAGDISRCSGREILPLRYLIMDGDDLTMICGARFALPAVITFLRQLTELANEELPVTACAGIAFVHSHFPFSIAYEIAEECCSNAKKSWYNDQFNQKAGYLDYQVIQGVYKKEEKIQREENGLRKRPYRVAEKADISSTESIEFLKLIQHQMAKEDNGIRKWPRNRLKKLYEAFLRSPREVESLNREFSARGYEISDLTAGMITGSYNSCGIFDALEIVDFYDEALYDEFFQTEGQGGKV